MNDAINIQRELFSLMHEIFRKATGKTPKAFAPLDGFSSAVHSTLPARISEVRDALEWGLRELYAFYERHRTSLFTAAKVQGGIKVVLGGGSRFGVTQLNAVRRLVLYSDTVLIPDPVFAWIETPRTEERFRHVQILEAMFFLLRLKPLVDCDSGIPPVIVFPSFERTLALHDLATKAELEHFYVEAYSSFLNHQFRTVDQIVEYTKTEEKIFLEAVANKHLFVAPGGPLEEPLDKAVERYLAEVRQYRSHEHIAKLESLSKGQLVGLATMERIEPQFHLMQNANELRAQPLLAVEQQAYYFKLLASFRQTFLRREHVISAQTSATVEALSRTDFAWLSNVSFVALAEMRTNNENENFRKRLSDATSLLSTADLSNLDQVVAEINVRLGSLLNEHNQEARKIKEKYEPKYSGMAVKGWLSVSTLLIPHLAPLISLVTPSWLAGHYVQTKSEERREARKLSSSLLGIVTHARAESSNYE